MKAIDSDFLEKRIHDHLIPLYYNGNNCDFNAGALSAISDILYMIKTSSALSLPEQRISVKDRLPEYQEKVLCFYENGFMGTAVFYGISADPHKSSNDFASYSHDYMTENSKIKFWMPLPEPPKENEDETD